MAEVLEIHLDAAARLARAKVAGLFIPSADGGLELAAQIDIDQAAWDATHITWERRRSVLQQGLIVWFAGAVLWPIVDGGELVAVIYLDHSRAGFPEAHEQANARVIATRIRHLGRPVEYRPYVAAVAGREEDQRRDLEIILRQTAGNIMLTADILGIDRQTVYNRAARFDLDLKSYKPQRPAIARRSKAPKKGDPKS